MLSLLLLTAVSWLMVRRLLNEDSWPLALSLSVSLFGALLLALANAGLDRPLLLVPGLLVTLGLLWKLARPGAPLAWPKLSSQGWTGLVVQVLVLVGYTNLYQNVFLEDDFWIHFPLQGLLRNNGLPVLHPFFSEIQMNGHYGRDLIIASAARHTELSLFCSFFWLQLIWQLATFGTLCGLAYRYTRSEISTVLTPLLCFFGIHVGGRTGLIDCFQNNNALAYLTTVSCLHALLLVYEQGTPARVALASFLLGVFALIYETHFGLVGLVLIVAVLVTRRRALLLVGLLALGLACLQGGPITKLVKSKFSPTQRAWTPGEMNQHQIIKLTFPKVELFQIQLARGDYQRIAAVYRFLPDLGEFTRAGKDTPYRPIWSWDVLKIHWLVTLMAPLTLVLLLRCRPREPLGPAFWLFGFFAYLTPAVVHFGPIYEFEYFRWQFAAGFGFAAALGVAVGKALQGRSAGWKIPLLSLLVLATLIPSWLIVLPPLWKVVMRQGRTADLFWPRNQASYLLANRARLGNFGYSDLKAAYRLRELAQPGQRVLVNGPAKRPFDIHYESALTGVTGLRSVGHSLPWPQELVGTPPFHESAPRRVFWQHPSEILLRRLRVDWLMLRRDQVNRSELREWCDERFECVWRDGDYRLYRVGFGAEEALGSEVLEETPQSALEVGLVPQTVRVGELFTFAVEGAGVWAWGWEGESVVSPLDRHEMVLWEGGPAAAVAPPLPGLYRLRFFSVEDGALRPTKTSLEIEVEPAKD